MQIGLIVWIVLRIDEQHCYVSAAQIPTVHINSTSIKLFSSLFEKLFRYHDNNAMCSFMVLSTQHVIVHRSESKRISVCAYRKLLIRTTISGTSVRVE